MVRRYSGERKDTKRNSPVLSMSRRIDYGATGLHESMLRARSDWNGPSRYLPPPFPTDTYPLLPPADLFPLPPPPPCPGACLPCPDPYIAQETETRIRMVEDFSSKISLKIR